jgi:S1-C subfamily serine protease
LTVAHGVAGQTSSQITTINGETFEAKIVAIDTAQDLALLKISSKPSDLRLPPLVFGQATAGEDAFFVAFNDQQQFVRKAKIQRRLKINTEDIYLKEKTTRLGIEAEVKVEVGNSGGPLVNKNGEIIGVVWSTSRITNNRTWATRVEAASALVDSLNSNPDPRTAKPVACTM